MKVGKYVFDVVGSDGNIVVLIEVKVDHDDFLRDCNKFEDIKKNVTEYRRLLIETADQKQYKKLINSELEKSYKFTDKSLLKLSTCRYIMAPDSLIDKDELPEDWGLLNEEPRLVVGRERNKIEDRFADKIVRMIGQRQTHVFLEKIVGVKFDKVIEFPVIHLEP